MDKHLRDCLSDNFEKKYIFPFFWQHGESHEVLKEEMDAIYNSGCRQFCVESRTHEDFCGDSWWVDFGFILEYATKRGMKVWLLDDKRFPTGYANGYIADHPELQMLHLKMIFRDIPVGSNPVTLLIPQIPAHAQLERVVAYRLSETGEYLTGDGCDLTRFVRNGLIYAALDPGIWRIYYLIRGNFAPESKRFWIDMLNPESAKAMLTAVYEPTYRHFSQYFGNTFLGFFSDEPGFANETGTYYSMLGKEDMPISYRRDLCQLIGQRCGKTEEEIYSLLPALWHTLNTDAGAAVRTYYMETISLLYKENFSMMLGNWCRERNVMYVGHIIEDNGSHMRTGYSAGHFFRSLDGQDMAGIDVVLHQIIPGMTDARHSAPLSGGYACPDMFNYLLAKLRSSHAHVDPKKKGRAMCEIYGAFGWAEGLPFMKRLTDHMLVNGINYYVPHAFTPKHNDPDCPPHFYNRGDNTQFSLFGKLMNYMQRMCHLISDGVHRADVAVLYAPEGEWSGCAYQLPEKVTQVLTRAQIDFDLIPADLLDKTETEAGFLLLNQEKYGALIIPHCQTLPGWILRQLQTIAAHVPVIFTETLPVRTAEGGCAEPYVCECRVVALNALPAHLRMAGLAHLELSKELPLVRFYHVSRNDAQVYLFANDDEWHEADFFVPLEGTNFALYDALNNTLHRPQITEAGVRIALAPGEMRVVISGITEEIPSAIYTNDLTVTPVQPEYTISKLDYGHGEYVPISGNLTDITLDDPTFCGRIRYEFTLPRREDTVVVLDLGVVGETAELWINNTYVGAAITNPYQFEITQLLREEENHIRIEVINNQAYRLRDEFSSYLPLPQSGMMGPVVLRTKN